MTAFQLEWVTDRDPRIRVRVDRGFLVSCPCGFRLFRDMSRADAEFYAANHRDRCRLYVEEKTP